MLLLYIYYVYIYFYSVFWIITVHINIDQFLQFIVDTNC